MSRNWLLTVLLCVILVVALFVGVYTFSIGNRVVYDVDVFVGVDAAYEDMSELKARVDQVKDYTNFFILGSTAITFDEVKLNEMWYVFSFLLVSLFCPCFD